MKSCAVRPAFAACSPICGMFPGTHGSPTANTKPSHAGAIATPTPQSRPRPRVCVERDADDGRRRGRVPRAIQVKPFYIFNTLARGVKEFQPLNPPVVTYYSCWPTVYLQRHLGNM